MGGAPKHCNNYNNLLCCHVMSYDWAAYLGGRLTGREGKLIQGPIESATLVISPEMNILKFCGLTISSLSCTISSRTVLDWAGSLRRSCNFVRNLNCVTIFPRL